MSTLTLRGIVRKLHHRFGTDVSKSQAFFSNFFFMCPKKFVLDTVGRCLKRMGWSYKRCALVPQARNTPENLDRRRQYAADLSNFEHNLLLECVCDNTASVTVLTTIKFVPSISDP